jgi:hypothetical protein
MELQYNEHLSKADRKMYTERLITLHNILAEDTSTEYKHQVWTQNKPYGFFKRLRTGHSCGTAACALGHALLHADRFPGLPMLDNRALIEYTRKYEGEEEARRIQPFTPIFGSADYFGPYTMDCIFSPNAYGVRAEEVTRQMAMDRIEQYITQVLGCKLIEA